MSSEEYDTSVLDGKADEATAAIADVTDPAHLDALESAEEEGKARSSVLNAIDDQRATLAEAPPADEVPAADASTEGAVALAEGQTTEPAEEADEPFAVQFVTTPGVAAPDPENMPVTYKKERMPPLNGETWVVLGKDDNVPDWAVGQIAAVIDPPRTHEVDPVNGNVTYYTDPDTIVHVRERSQGAEFWIPIGSVQRVSLAGRPGVLPFP